jgi:4-alpha-glucanotransferase
MTDGADLDRLAELVGIEPFYHDIWGNRREIGPATKRDLIQAMGFPAGSPEEAADSLYRLTERQWRRMLTPVFVLGDGDSPQIDFTVPEQTEPAGITWTLSEEVGDVHWGEQPLSQLPPVAEAVFDDVRYTRHKLALPTSLPHGYHRLAIQLNVGGGVVHEGAAMLILTPNRCLTPDELVEGGGQTWGVGVQLYALRSPTNWGIGDYTDAGAIAERAAKLGAGVLGLNPLHALFPADPNHNSPYSPSNRGFLNTLYIDVAGLLELEHSAKARKLVGSKDFQQRLRAVREAELVNYAAVSDLKMPVLELLFQSARSAQGQRWDAFLLFQREMDEPLVRQATFDALHEHFYKGQGKWSWQEWPEAFRDPDGEAVARFARENAERIEFFQWLQWVADDQLGAAAHRARAAGMPIGFYRDLAVANHPGGAAAWATQDVIVRGASVGSPPDMFNPGGQNWGLAPLSPVGLIETGYAAFIDVLRANMRHAGAVRIDHVMALQHLFWIPDRPDHEGGAYVSYPFRDLLRIVALESRRNHCLVIGEDLGTVPEGFRPVMQQAGVLSYRVLYFERGEDRGFIAPEHYPRDALVTATTHDLPTLKGWWTGRDIEWRDRIGQFKDAEALEAEWQERRRDRERLLASMRWWGAVPPDTGADELTPELVAGIHRYLAMTPGRMLMVQVEDVVGEVEQPNLPGTVDEHPNWRHKLPVTVEDIGAAPLLTGIAAAVQGVWAGSDQG